MQDLKISLITVVRNAEHTIARCIESVIAQNFTNLEYIVIDGASTDNTIKIIEQYKDHISLFISEPDNGIYDAMNKGITKASGTIIGMLNADDVFADSNVLGLVADGFIRQKVDIIYGNLDYVNAKGNITRVWKSGIYKHGLFNWGWMPPHPTFYCKKQLFEHFGSYNTNYGTAADYELMLRFMHLNKPKVFYLNVKMVKMNKGGVSNQHYISYIKAWGHDLKAMKHNSVMFPSVIIFVKPLRKVFQYSLFLSKIFR